MRRLPWWPVAIALAALGLVIGSPWLVTMGVFVLAAGAVALGSARLALRRVTYERSLSHSHVFAGESVELELGLANDKLLPLAWVKVVDEVAEGLDYGSLPVGASSGQRRLRLEHNASLRPYERIRWRHTVGCPLRGYYHFGPVRLQSGDIFGLYRTNRVDDGTAQLVVYPVVRPLRKLGFPAGEPFGGRKSDQPLLRDPLRPVGVRDYRPEDSRRQVHWKATSRTGDLKVKVLEAVSQEAAVVVLNTATFDQAHIGVDPATQERLIVVAASLAYHAVEEGHAVGLVANGSVPGSGRPIHVPCGRHPRGLGRILESLAAVSAFVNVPIDRLLAAESRRAPWGATLVVVTAIVGEALEVELLRLRRAGRRVALVSLDPRYSGSLPGIQTTHLPPEGIEFSRVAA
jgi:uncharacterized protein (DUF58 family)